MLETFPLLLALSLAVLSLATVAAPEGQISGDVSSNGDLSDAGDTSEADIDAVLASHFGEETDLDASDAAETAISDTGIANTAANTVTMANTTANTTQTTANTAPDPDDFSTIPATDARGRENKLPHSRVKVLIDKAVSQATSSLQPQIDAYTQERQAIDQFFTGEPEVVLRHLATINPGFQRYLQPGQPAAQTTPQQTATSEEPQPDVRLADGTLTYSKDRMQQWMTWKTEQTLAAQLAPVQQMLDGQRQQQALANKAQFIETARRDWPGFKEAEAEIRHVFNATPALRHAGPLGVELAYRQVREEALLKQASDAETAARAKVAAEQAQKAITSPTASTRTAAVGSSADPDAEVDAVLRKHFGSER